MTRGAKSNLPNFMYLAGEKAQGPLDSAGAIGKKIISLATGSNSPAYIQDRWRAYTSMSPRDITPVRFVPGDPNVRRFALPRSYSRATILAASRQAFHEAVPEGTLTVPAVAFVSKDMVHIGRMPNNRNYFSLVGDTGHEGAAFRLGRGALLATIGRFSEEEEKLYVPHDVRVIVPSVAIKDIPERYPGLTLA